MFKKLFLSESLDNIVIDGVDFSLKHTIRKNMTRIILRVVKKNEVQLSSSKFSKKRLLDFIEEHKNWIILQHENLSELFGEGNAFYYLSQAYSIRHHNLPLLMNADDVYLNPLKAKMQSDTFYKRKAQELLPLRVEFWKEKMGLDFQKLRFHCAKRRWGSCSSKGVITLNPYMMKLGYEMIDYIIVHELAHLKHMNHSKEFYRLVEVYIPSYKTIQRQIHELSMKMLKG